MGQDSFSVSVAFSSCSNNMKFTLTTVYAPCDDSLWPDFFSFVNNVIDQVNGAWILIGDFNMYRYDFEKNNDKVNWSLMEQFNDWINGHGLMDIDIANRRFTWPNKHRDPTLVKLDSVLVNADWSLDFLDTSALCVTSVTLDHVPTCDISLRLLTSLIHE